MTSANMKVSVPDSIHPVLTIARYDEFSDDVQSVLDQNELIQSHVSRHETRYKLINVAESLSELTTVGDLLSVGYMGSKGFQCNVQVVRMLANYQTLGKDSQLACSRFLTTSMLSLKYHRLAFQMVLNKKPSKSLEFLTRISSAAEEMSKVAGDLEKKASDMCALGADALQVAANDGAVSTEKKKKIQDQLTDLKAKTAKGESAVEELASQVSDARKNEMAAARHADQARQQALNLTFLLSSLGLVADIAGKLHNLDGLLDSQQTINQTPEYIRLTSTIAEQHGKLAGVKLAYDKEENEEKKKQIESKIHEIRAQIQSFEESRKSIAQQTVIGMTQKIKNAEAEVAAQREAKFREERLKLEEQNRLVKADLAESLERLKWVMVQDDQLSTALHSLDLAINALGRIKTVFENTRIYWVTIKGHCDALVEAGKDMRLLTEDGLEEMLSDAITDSWYSWLALARINHTATVAMSKVIRRVDNVMNNLPMPKEIRPRLDQAIAKLERQLRLEASVPLGAQIS